LLLNLNDADELKTLLGILMLEWT